MCELCDAYGEGQLWYKNPKNYARELYKRKPKDYKPKEFGEDPELEGGRYMFAAIAAKSSDPERFPELKQQANEAIRKYSICHVLPLQDAKEVIDIASPVAMMSCICRRSLRARDERDAKSYTCMAVGVGGFKWERWPERYKGGVEFPTAEEAKKWLEGWNKKGMVHLIMTAGTPYIGGICNCDYDCMALRIRLEYDIDFVLKAHYVARVDFESCNGCGTCLERCQFGAIRKNVTLSKVYIDPFKCFGCGLCETGCPQEAISLVDRASLPALKEVW